MFPCFTKRKMNGKVKNKKLRNQEQWGGKKRRKGKKTNLQESSFDSRHGQSRRICPSNRDPSQMTLWDGDGLKVCVSHVFPSPSNDVSCDFSFLIRRRREIVWKSFGAALIFVWSIQSRFVSLRKCFLARGEISATTQAGKKVCKLFRHKKKESKKCCHVVLLFPAFDNGTKCWNSFCQGNSAIQRQCSIFSFLFFRHHVKTFRVGIFEFSFFSFFSSVVVASLFCRNQIYCIALHLEIGIEFSSYLRFNDGKRGWIKLSARLCFISLKWLSIKIQLTHQFLFELFRFNFQMLFSLFPFHHDHDAKWWRSSGKFSPLNWIAPFDEERNEVLRIILRINLSSENWDKVTLTFAWAQTIGSLRMRRAQIKASARSLWDVWSQETHHPIYFHSIYFT